MSDDKTKCIAGCSICAYCQEDYADALKLIEEMAVALEQVDQYTRMIVGKTELTRQHIYHYQDIATQALESYRKWKGK